MWENFGAEHDRMIEAVKHLSLSEVFLRTAAIKL
jgi:hypothetical protein